MPHAPARLRFDGAPLTLAALHAALSGPVRAELPEGARAAIAHGRVRLEAAASAGQPIYGMTTGVGAMKGVAHEGEAMAAFNHGLGLAHQVAVGEPVEPGVARLALAIRLNTAASGRAGVSVDFARFLAAMLDRDILPYMARRGSVGCADLGQMGQLAAAMTGEGLVVRRGRIVRARDAFAAERLSPYRMRPREGLAAVGTNAYGLASATSAALGALRVVRRALAQAPVTALAWGLDRGVWECAAASLMPQEPAIAAFLRDATAGQDDWPARTSVHDAISARFVVQALAPCLVAAEELATTVALCSGQVDDNPAILDDGRVQTSGASHFGLLALRLAALQAALAQLGRNLFNHALMLTGGQLPGLPVNLVPPGVIATGYGPLMKLAMEQTARISAAAAPVAPFALTLAAGLEDEALLLPLSAERLADQIAALDWTLAIVALVSVQAIALRGLRPVGLAAETAAVVRRHVPPLTADIALSEPLEALRADLAATSAIARLVALAPFPTHDEDFVLPWLRDATVHRAAADPPAGRSGQPSLPASASTHNRQES